MQKKTRVKGTAQTCGHSETTVRQFWTNFAASGDPNKRGGSDALGEWPRAAEDRNIVLEPTADMKMRDEPKVGAANCDVWDAIAAGGDGL